MNQPLLVTAHLCTPLAGDAPQLDGLLEWALSPFFDRAQPCADGHYKLTRAGPAPKQGGIPIPLVRVWLGPWLVARCSSPILGPCVETVDHICKRLSTENASLLDPAERTIVSTTNSWTKSYRLPLRVRRVELVRWFCCGHAREVRKALKRVHAIGKKPADGYGRVARWTAEPTPDDLSWYAPHDAGRVLMRPLPNGPWLPKDLIGFKRDFGACCPPQWHPERATEIIVPC